MPWSEIDPVFDQLLEAIKQYHTNELRTVVFGGGSGLSSILGGDTTLSTWHQAPFDGLKRMFPRLTVAVCVTDDGGSSGKLLRDLGCIAVGDLRRAVLSWITPRGLLSRYSSLNLEQLESMADALQHILNYRFSRNPNRRFLKAPSTVLSQKLRRSVPDSLLEYLDRTGASFLEDPLLKDIRLEEQCLGNLLLVSSIYSQRKGGKQKDLSRRFTPTHLQIMKGIQDFACRIGAGPDTIFPAYTTQGEIQVLYQHGVMSSGEAKSARKHSSFPVDRVWVHFVRKPQVSAELLKKIEEADLIICAPGSLYTSIIPIFQVPAITEAVRNNRRAVKVLGANFWAQRGETDISVRLRGKEFYVSDIIEAYHNNIAGGAAGLFESIIVTDLQSIPGDILRNYALEGKVPIYLDKQRVREMGIEPVEAAVFSEQKLRNEKVIQHDPVKFARVVKTLYYLRRHIKKHLPAPSLPPSPFVHGIHFPRKGFLSDHWAAIHQRVRQMDTAHPKLRKVLLDILWDNREILLEHLSFIRGIKKVRRQNWTRSTEWDNILGY
ncbi:MAG: YvcK family protein [Nitrospirae bacterium]|nr:YvcK family protein [Nitrospirota bacterium]